MEVFGLNAKALILHIRSGGARFAKSHRELCSIYVHCALCVTLAPLRLKSPAKKRNQSHKAHCKDRNQQYRQANPRPLGSFRSQAFEHVIPN